jgi:hypothetical protein
MNYQRHSEQLSRLSAQLEVLFTRVSACGRDPLPPELADEIAATAGEVMVELADHRDGELAKGVLECARRLREVVRSLCPEAGHVTETGRSLVSDLELVIRQERRAA